MGNAAHISSCSDIAKPSHCSRSRAFHDSRHLTTPNKEQTTQWYDKMCESKSSQDLFVAASNGDLKAAMSSLVAHGDTNCCNAEGFTPLMMAAAGGHLEVARLLVTSNARVNASPCRHGLSPLGLASAQGCADIARLLLQWRADANIGHVDGNAPLSRAAHRGHVEVCVALLDHHADMNAYDRAGLTAGMQAVEGEHLEVTQLLVQRGASMAPVDKRSRSALHRAIDVLLQMEDRRQGIATLRSPMSEYDYWSEMCAILVEAKASPDVVDCHGETLLYRTVRYRRRDVMAVLLDIGADRDFPIPAIGGGSVLLFAAEEGARELCQTLIMRAALVNQASTAGVTPLCAAIAKGHEELCFYFLQCGADFNRRDPRDGQTFLMKAAAGGMRGLYDRLRPHVSLPAVAEPEVPEEAATDDDADAEYQYISDDSEDAR